MAESTSKNSDSITIFKRSGWAKHDDRYMFVHADMPAFSNVKSECEQTIVAEDVSPINAFNAALDILKLGKLRVLLPLMLTALLAP